MRKDYLFFFVLVLAAAVVAGSAVGFISNFDIVVQHLKNVNSQSTHSSALEPINTADNAKAISLEEQKDDQISVPVQSFTALTNGSEELMVITDQEKEQVLAMLQMLGMPQGGDYNQFISQFQSAHSLPSTGCLDSRTLRVIINETTRSRAAAF
ncbi:hypothetical protein [Syntrophomonas palmitatica]|uniref:hypothetical protein n=1 Tax=Syntrophomonas palmitatica TaxID=402877 RepID=UPI0006D28A9E|nr:hypothetical protein [Syntrophomonas palmitatica]